MSRRLLILGHGGQLARALAEAAPGFGYVAMTAGRSRADLAERGAVSALIEAERPDVVINAAAYTKVDEAEVSPELCHAVNAQGAGEAAVAAFRTGSRLVHVSTDYVFTGDGPHGENASPCPANVYGRSKLAGELAVLDAAPGAAIVRASGVFSGSGADFPSAMWRLAHGDAPIRVVDDQLLSPVYAGDLAERLLALASRPDASGLFHCAGRPGASWYEVACEALATLADAGGPAKRPEPVGSAGFKRRAARPSDSRLASERLEAATGLPAPDWRAALGPALSRWLDLRRAATED